MVEFALIAPMLFLLLLGIIEASRFVFYLEVVNNAAREGARYAIVHGANSSCPSGPPPPGQTPTGCWDVPGDNVKSATTEGAFNLTGVGDLFVHDPVWTPKGQLIKPSPGDSSTGHSGRGEHVTVFVDYSYGTLLDLVFGVEIIPDITISAESTLVINN